MGARGRKSILRESVKSLLLQHKTTGVDFDVIEQRFGAVDRRRLIKLLDNLRLCGDAHCKRSQIGSTATWYPGAAGADEYFSPADWRRVQRARQEDTANPIVFYGQRLVGGRCSSVWEYARHMQVGARA